MKSLLEKIDLGTKSFYCENCGEVVYGNKFRLTDEIESIHWSIEEICEYCADNL